MRIYNKNIKKEDMKILKSSDSNNLHKNAKHSSKWRKSKLIAKISKFSNNKVALKRITNNTAKAVKNIDKPCFDHKRKFQSNKRKSVKVLLINSESHTQLLQEYDRWKSQQRQRDWMPGNTTQQDIMIEWNAAVPRYAKSPKRKGLKSAQPTRKPYQDVIVNSNVNRIESSGERIINLESILQLNLKTSIC